MAVPPMLHYSQLGEASRGNEPFRSAAGRSTAPGRHHDERTLYPHNPPLGYNPDYQSPIRPRNPPRMATTTHPGVWQAPAIAAPFYIAPPPGPLPQTTAPPEYELHPTLKYSRGRVGSTTQGSQQPIEFGVHMCQSATEPNTPWIMVVINYGDTATRVPVHASPTNPTTVTVGDVLTAIDEIFLDLDRTWEGNDPYGSNVRRNEDVCLCLRLASPIDYFRDVYGKAGLVKSREGPYTFEWKVRSPG